MRYFSLLVTLTVTFLTLISNAKADISLLTAIKTESASTSVSLKASAIGYKCYDQGKSFVSCFIIIQSSENIPDLNSNQIYLNTRNLHDVDVGGAITVGSLILTMRDKGDAKIVCSDLKLSILGQLSKDSEMEKGYSCEVMHVL